MSPDLPFIEIRDWGRPPRRIQLRAPLTIGRDCDGHNLDDSEVSRAHVRLVPSPTALSAVDLGSRNGTTLNGVPLTARASLAAGDVLRLGRSEIIVVSVPTQPNAEQPSAPPDHDATSAFLRVAAPPPPPPGEPAARRSVALTLAERVLDIDATGTRDLFPPSTELPRVVGLRVWQVLRALSVIAYCSLIVTLFVYPAAGLFVFFGIIVPLLPVLFLTAPGLWRNVCPLAATNQVPRLFGFSRAISPPGWLRNRGYLVAMALFFGIAGARLAGLDSHGAATGVVLAAVGLAAFTGGVIFAGKSGWCSSICPLFPLQRAYGQTPYVTVANSHCPTCVGCAKNCYDFSPRAAYEADLADEDHSWTAARKLFVAALPGFILGFFTMATRADLAPIEKYPLLALFVLVSVGTFYAVEAVTPLSQSMVAVGFAAAALNIFYWFAGFTLAASFTTITGLTVPWLHWVFTAVIVLLTALWIARTRVRELQFAWTTGTRTQPVLLVTPKRPAPTTAQSGPQVRFGADGAPVAAEPGVSVLELAERAGVTIEAGCRMGVCGADPVGIVDGAAGLTPAEKDELNTLRRLGFGASTRMACCARVNSGTVTVSLTPEPGDGGGQRPTRYDRSIVSVVVVGGGIAGVTAADFVRRGHPDCEIHLVGDESHSLYNRMGISRLVYGRSAMQGLYLLPEQWYDDHGVHPWLNTIARRIDVRERRVVLGTGDALPYDRLILAMGSRAAVPSVGGINRPGSFVLRQAGDAMGLRGYVQQHGCRRALVAGGGLLGLEAAYSLRLLGLQVCVLERGERLLHRQIDSRCSELVARHFADSGIEVLFSAETEFVDGRPQVSAAVLKNGRRVPCDVFVAATGIQPNTELARDAGIPVRKGVLVDDMMRTRTRWVYAAGDVAEHHGQVLGLWPVAVAQAETAAVNALGGDRVIHADVPATILKGVGLELFSIGRVRHEPSDLVIVVERPEIRSYRKLVLSEMRVVGATVLGHHPADVAAAQKAVHAGQVLNPHMLGALRSGDWSALAATAAHTGLSQPHRSTI